jgi:hypothetical protein
MKKIMRSLLWNLLVSVVFFCLTPEVGLGQNSHPVGLEIVNYDQSGTVAVPNFHGVVVAVNFDYHVRDTRLQELIYDEFGKRGARYVAFHPEDMPTEGEIYLEAYNKALQSGASKEAAKAAGIEAKDSEAAKDIAKRKINPCLFPGQIILCITIESPVPGNSATSNDNFYLSGNGGGGWNTSSSSSSQSNFFTAIVKVDLYENPGGDSKRTRLYIRPLGAIGRTFAVTNGTTWSSSSGQGWGFSGSYSGGNDSYVEFINAAGNAVQDLLKNKHRQAWLRGSPELVTAAFSR